MELGGFPLIYFQPFNEQRNKIMLESSLQLQTRTILNNKQFNCVRKIGKGGFGHVLLATKATNSSAFYAIKCLSRKKMIKDPQLKKSLIQEINTMASLQHPNIVKLYKTFQEGDWYFLVMEYCDMGNLYSIQSKTTSRVFGVDQAINIFGQLLRGVEVIHRNKIVHRDLKLENIFVKKTEKNGLLCKIGDFGLARFVQMAANSNCGTQNYMAPEILKTVPYGHEVDIWSLGVLLFYMLFGEFPFKGINILEDIIAKCKNGFKVIDHVKAKTVFRNRKEEVLFNDFFMKIFEIDREKRATVQSLREHGVLRIKSGEDVSTEEDEGANEKGVFVQMEVNQMRFIQKIAREVETSGFLSPFLLLGFKFYISKMVLCMLNKDFILNYKKDKDGHPKLLKVLSEMQSDVMVKMERLITQIKECKEREPIPHFDDGLNKNYQEFAKFKIGYRNTVGRVYQEVHRKYPENTYERASLKLKVFLCHIINRVFAGSFNPALFPHFATWLKKDKNRISKIYDFRLLQEWIKNESIDNLNSSQEIINKAFYK